jgi:hypothetical protein
MQVDTGVVGADGYMHTSSQPYEDIERTQILLFSIGVGAIGLGLIAISPLAGSLVGGALLGEGAEIAFLAGTVAIEMTRELTRGINLPVGSSNYEAFVIPKLGPPAPTTGQVTIAPGVNQLNVAVEPSPDSQTPTLSSGALQFNNGSTELVIDGTNFNANTAVVFQMGDQGQSFTSRPDSVTPTELDVTVPENITLGLAQVSVVQVIRDSLGNIISQGLPSNPLTFPATPYYAFSAQPVSSMGTLPVVSVIDANPASQTFNQLIDTINIQGIIPQYVRVTLDNTRVLVTGTNPATGSAGIAVLDAVDLQQLDVNSLANPEIAPGSTPSIITLPTGAKPFQIAISPDDLYAFISDQSSGSVYVVDIDPSSSTYLQYRTISITAANGLAGLDVSGDGKYLVVAVPNRSSYYAMPTSPQGSIGIVTIDSTQPSWQAFWSQGLPLPVTLITAGDYPYGVTASPDPNIVAFTDIDDDANGVGLLNLTDNSVRYIRFTLAKPLGNQAAVTQSFGVSGAQKIVFTPDGKFAFVTAYDVFNPDNPKQDTGFRFNNPYLAGSNIAVIEDPLNPQGPGVVAATRPLPESFPHDLAISPDGQFLYATFGVALTGGDHGAVFVYNVQAIENEVTQDYLQNITVTVRLVNTGGVVTLPILLRYPVDDVTNGVWTSQQIPNVLIDIKADYQVVPGSPNFFFAIQQPDPLYAPLAIGGNAKGIALQPNPDPVTFLTPLGSTTEQSPVFQWYGPPGSKIYIGPCGTEAGQFPDEEPANLIVDGAGPTSYDPTSGVATYMLPPGIYLSPGECYDVEVSATDANGHVWREVQDLTYVDIIRLICNALAHDPQFAQRMDGIFSVVPGFKPSGLADFLYALVLGHANVGSTQLADQLHAVFANQFTDELIAKQAALVIDKTSIFGVVSAGAASKQPDPDNPDQDVQYATSVALTGGGVYIFDWYSSFDPNNPNTISTDPTGWQAISLSALPQEAAVAPGPNSSSSGASLTPGELMPIVKEAEQVWKTAGLNSSELASLDHAQFEILSLPAGYFGLESSPAGQNGEPVILIDRQADGYAWFLGGPTSGAVPAGEVDLLTVVEHELGHVLGLPDLDPALFPNDIMTETLAPGERRIPTPFDVASIASGTTLLSKAVTSVSPPAGVTPSSWIEQSISAEQSQSPVTGAVSQALTTTSQLSSSLTTLETSSPVGLFQSLVAAGTTLENRGLFPESESVTSTSQLLTVTGTLPLSVGVNVGPPTSSSVPYPQGTNPVLTASQRIAIPPRDRQSDPARSAPAGSSSPAPKETKIPSEPVILERRGLPFQPVVKDGVDAWGYRESFHAAVLDAIAMDRSDGSGTLDHASVDEIALDVLIARQAAAGLQEDCGTADEPGSQQDATDAEKIESPSIFHLALGLQAVILGAWGRIRSGYHRTKQHTDDDEAE